MFIVFLRVWTVTLYASKTFLNTCKIPPKYGPKQYYTPPNILLWISWTTHWMDYPSSRVYRQRIQMLVHVIPHDVSSLFFSCFRSEAPLDMFKALVVFTCCHELFVAFLDSLYVFTETLFPGLSWLVSDSLDRFPDLMFDTWSLVVAGSDKLQSD